MKKILSIILAAAMLCGMLTLGAGAETSATDVIDALEYVMNDYLWLAEWCGGYYPIDGAPAADAVDMCFKSAVESQYDEYCVSMDEYGFAKYEVPADVYENEIVPTVFAKTDALMEKLHAADFYKTDKDSPYYLIEVGGGFGGPLPYIAVQGFTKGEDGLYTAYSYFVETIVYDEDWNELVYVPAEGEVEGKDYIIIGTNTYEYDEETDTVLEGFAYVPAKITSGHKSTVELDVDNWTAVYHSYEKIDPSLLPSAEDMTVRGDVKDVAYVGGAFMEIDRGSFDEGTVVYGEELLDDPESDNDAFDTTAALVKDHGELGGVYDFTAMKDGATVQPNGKIAVSFIMPYDFSPDTAVYYVADNGDLTKLETAIDPDSVDPWLLYATAELEHFSRYAVVGTRYGDSNSDGNVNLSDVSAMLKSVAKWEVELNDVAVDANRDGKVTLSDITLVMKYIAGWDVWFGEDYKPAEPTPEIPEVPGMEIDGNGVLVKYTGTDTEVVIPEGVTAIGDEAFRDCREITSITIPDSVAHIGDMAFCDCRLLESIVIPDSVTSVGDFLFTRCRNLKSITLSSGLDEIGYAMLEECNSLVNVTIPDNVTRIEKGAFYGCKSLKSITLPEGVTSIGDSVFDGCDNLEEVILPNGLASIGKDAFSYCPKLCSITIPESVTYIGDAAFRDNEGIVISCYADSAAHVYTVENGISYLIIGAE